MPSFSIEDLGEERRAKRARLSAGGMETIGLALAAILVAAALVVGVPAHDGRATPRDASRPAPTIAAALPSPSLEIVDATGLRRISLTSAAVVNPCDPTGLGAPPLGRMPEPTSSAGVRSWVISCFQVDGSTRDGPASTGRPAP